MRTRRDSSYCPYYLIAIGITSIIIMGSVSVIRYFYNLNVVANSFLYKILSYEPYIEIAADLAVFLVFLVPCVKNSGRRDRTLMMLWGFVQVPMQVVYFLSSSYYTTLIDTMTDFAGTMAYVAFYTSTHVLKYCTIFYVTAFALFVTGLLLGDYVLPIVSLLLCVAYTASFSIHTMPSITLPSMPAIGIVIPAFLYHVTESVVMIAAGVYLNIRFAVHRKRSAPTIENAINDTKRKSQGNRLFKK